MVGKVVVKCHMGIVRVQAGLGFAAAHRLPRLVGSKLALKWSLFLKSHSEDDSREQEC